MDVYYEAACIGEATLWIVRRLSVSLSVCHISAVNVRFSISWYIFTYITNYCLVSFMTLITRACLFFRLYSSAV